MSSIVKFGKFVKLVKYVKFVRMGLAMNGRDKNSQAIQLEELELERELELELELEEQALTGSSPS